MALKNLISLTLFLCVAAAPAYAELRTNQPADVVVGQPNFTSNSDNQGGSAGANTLSSPAGVFSDGKRLFIVDISNNRVLIYNSIPTTNNASADVVIGQLNFTSSSGNQGNASSPRANTLLSPAAVYAVNGKLFIAEISNRRVLIYNSIPTSNNASADIVLGQTSFTTQTANQGGIGANTLSAPRFVWSDGKKLIVGDDGNKRFLVYNSLPASNKASADVVIGQSNFISSSQYQGGSAAANNIASAWGIASDGKKLILDDPTGHRILVYNNIPTVNNASADVVIGQSNFSSTSGNQGGAAGPNTISNPKAVYFDGKRLFVWDRNNHRVLIFNSLPTHNNASADAVIGQPDFSSVSANEGGTVGANTLQGSGNLYQGLYSDGKRLFVADTGNHRVLIYNIGSSSIQLGPQFEQGKAVLGKVFNDTNANGWQDKGEKGIEGVKIASDTGIYAITDSGGKYHFPYIETGARVLKIDPSTLPEGSVVTTSNPAQATVTKGILTKISFGVKLPQELNEELSKPSEPLLNVSISQDPVLLKPKLGVSAAQEKNNIIFTINCNYYLFVEKSKLTLYDQDYKLIKSIDLPNPIPTKYTLPISELKNQKTLYYQLSVYDKNNKEDRTGVGNISYEK